MRKATKIVLQEMSLYIRAGNGIMSRYGMSVEDYLELEREVGILGYIKENKEELQEIELDGMIAEIESYIEYKGVYLGVKREVEREVGMYKHVMHLNAIHKAYKEREKRETKESVYKRYIKSKEYKIIEETTLEQVKAIQGIYDEIGIEMKEDERREEIMYKKLEELGLEVLGLERVKGGGKVGVGEISIVVMVGEYLMSRWGKTPEEYKEIERKYRIVNKLLGYRAVVGELDPVEAIEMIEEYIEEQGGEIETKTEIEKIEEGINTNQILLMIYGLRGGLRTGYEIEERYLEILGGDGYREMKENKSKKGKEINKRITEIIKESIKQEK